MHGWVNLPEVIPRMLKTMMAICVRSGTDSNLLLLDFLYPMPHDVTLFVRIPLVFFQGYLRHLSNVITTYNLLNPKASSNVA